MLNAFVYYIRCLNENKHAAKTVRTHMIVESMNISSIPAHKLYFILFDVNLRTVMLFV